MQSLVTGCSAYILIKLDEMEERDVVFSKNYNEIGGGNVIMRESACVG